MIKFPNQKSKRWTGPYLGNYQGDLWRTYNIDLDNSPGHITISRRFIHVADSTDSNLTHMGVVGTFLRSDADCIDRYWGQIINGRLLKTDTINPLDLNQAKWVEDGLSNSPTDARDMTIHENDSNADTGSTTANSKNFLLVTRDTAVAALNDTATNVWNADWGSFGLKTNVAHPIEYFPYQRISLIGDGNLIHIIDKTKAITKSRLILPIYLEAFGIFTTPFRSWILCIGKQGRDGAVVEWDGFTQTYNYIHEIKGSNPLSGLNYNGIPIIINNRGLILEYNGSTFVPMIRNGQKICFPSYEEFGNSFSQIKTGNSPSADMSPRGMTITDDGLIHINIRQPQLPSFKQLGGIWCLNPEKGRLYSKYSLGMGSDTDFGNQHLAQQGAIKAISAADGDTSSTYLLAGGALDPNVSLDIFRVIWALQSSYSSTVGRGYFITQFVEAEQIQDLWDSMYFELSKFRSSNSRIILKARGVNPLIDANKRALEAKITWTSTTTFTVTLNSGDDQLAVGDEVEVIAGKNGGSLTHITTISGAHAALQTITIDEAGITASGTSIVRFERWKKCGVIDSVTKYIVPLKIGITSSFIQLKVELRGPALDFDIKSLTINPVLQTINQK